MPCRVFPRQPGEVSANALFLVQTEPDRVKPARPPSTAHAATAHPASAATTAAGTSKSGVSGWVTNLTTRHR